MDIEVKAADEAKREIEREQEYHDKVIIELKDSLDSTLSH